MIEVIAALIRWLAHASRPIGFVPTIMLRVAYLMWKRPIISDEDPAAKHRNTVSEELR
jgi:hypothetical protein